jgi:Uma2 family endonuclease
MRGATAELLSPEPMTLEAWADLDEPGELVDGQLVEEEMPTILHELVVGWFFAMLRAWAAPRGGWVFGSEHKLAVSGNRGRKADVTMYAPGTRLRMGDAISRIPPAVVVEVISPRPRDVRRDRLEKTADYARFGVRFYWLMDPQARLLEIVELSPDGHHMLVRSASTGKLRVPGFEGFELNLDELWAEVDRLDADEVATDEAAESSDS